MFVCSIQRFEIEKNIVIQIELDKYLIPFGKIMCIVVNIESKYKIICNVLANKGFIDHYFVYEIEKTDVDILKNIIDLNIEHISTFYCCKGTKMVT